MHKWPLPARSRLRGHLTTYVVGKWPRSFLDPAGWPLVHADTVVAALAGEQHGCVSSSQLTLAGLSRRQIERRLQSGHLIRLHRGVYAVGHRALLPLADFSAALLAVGPHATLNHRASAVIWKMLDREEGADRRRGHPGPAAPPTGDPRPQGQAAGHQGARTPEGGQPVSDSRLPRCRLERGHV